MNRNQINLNLMRDVTATEMADRLEHMLYDDERNNRGMNSNMTRNNWGQNKANDTESTSTVAQPSRVSGQYLYNSSKFNDVKKRERSISSESRRPHRNRRRTHYLPPPGQPGGLDDPRRKGLSGACTRWYLRYLEQGMDPEEARRRAGEHRTKPPPLDDYVPLSPISATQHQEQQPKTTRGYTTMERPVSGMSLKSMLECEESINHTPNTLTVLPEDYPQVTLDDELLSQLENALIAEMAQGWVHKLKFNGISYKRSMLLINCETPETAKWLRMIVPKLTKWKGPPIIAYKGDGIAKTHIISLILPNSASQRVDASLALIDAQNDDLNTRVWKVLQCHNEGTRQNLTVAIDNFSYETLRALNGRLNYKFGEIIAEYKMNTEALSGGD